MVSGHIQFELGFAGFCGIFPKASKEVKKIYCFYQFLDFQKSRECVDYQALESSARIGHSYHKAFAMHRAASGKWSKGERESQQN